MNKCNYCNKETDLEPRRKGAWIMCKECQQKILGIIETNKKTSLK